MSPHSRIRRRIESRILIVVGLCLLWPVRNTGAEEWSQSQWEQTVYYRFSFKASGDAVLRLTAVDSYEVFFAGESLGTNDDWTTVKEYPITLEKTNHVGVRVDNSGQGAGSGLLAEIVGPEGLVWSSSTATVSKVTPPLVWFWTTEPDDKWLTDGRIATNPAWGLVQRGQLDRSQLTGWREDESGAEVIAAFPGDVDGGQPETGLTLRTTRGENLATEKPANRPGAFDGRHGQGWVINPTSLSAVARVDLLRPRLVGGVRVHSFDQAQTLRGYGVQVSNQGFRWSEVGVVHGNDQIQSEIAFEPVLSRFVQVIVAEVDPTDQAAVAEIEIFGAGVAPEGSYVSPPLSLGQRGQPKAFDTVRWVGERPEGTDLRLQFRSSDDTNNWSSWSEPIESERASLHVPEPRIWLQYRAEFATQLEDVAPRLDSLIIGFSDRFPASEARAWVAPNDAVLGRDTTFTYNLALDFGPDDLGVKRVSIATPSQATVLRVDPPEGVEEDEDARVTRGDQLELTFASPWTESGTLTVDLQARLLRESFAFTAQVYAGEEGVSLDVEESAGRNSWMVHATEIEGQLLDGVRARPAVFSPNGDGVNEGTVVEFRLARVDGLQLVEVGIFDLGGRLVRMLTAQLDAGEYVRPLGNGDVSALPGFWDGLDGSDPPRLVPPGLYLARVRVRLGRNDEVQVTPVGVVY